MKKQVTCAIILLILFLNINTTGGFAQIQSSDNNETLIKEIIQLQEEIKDMKKDSDKLFSGADYMACFATLVALLGIWWSRKTSEKVANMETETQSKQRLIDVVSAQRVEWINNLRINFSQFSRVIHKLALLRSRNKDLTDEDDDLIAELNYWINHLELFLNPTEIISKKFSEKKEKLKNYLMSEEPFSWVEYSKILADIHYVEQVILKAEWARLKVETTTGEEVKDMEKLHEQTAEDIDSDRFLSLSLKQEYENRLKINN